MRLFGAVVCVGAALGQNLMSSDCARARVGLCTRRDPLCIPFQDIFSSDNSSAARAVGVAAAVLDKDCPIPEPVVPGVRVSEGHGQLSCVPAVTTLTASPTYDK